MNNASILDETKLDKFNFEGAIAVGMEKSAICTMFNKSMANMDKWCADNYNGLNFATVYEIIKFCAYKEFLTVVKDLGYRGNPSALNIINQAINDKAAGSVVKIVFDNGGVEPEREEDKLDEEERY